MDMEAVRRDVNEKLPASTRYENKKGALSGAL
jgi:hypothetical protein